MTDVKNNANALIEKLVGYFEWMREKYTTLLIRHGMCFIGLLAVFVYKDFPVFVQVVYGLVGFVVLLLLGFYTYLSNEASEVLDRKDMLVSIGNKLKDGAPASLGSMKSLKSLSTIKESLVSAFDAQEAVEDATSSIGSIIALLNPLPFIVMGLLTLFVWIEVISVVFASLALWM